MRNFGKHLKNEARGAAMVEFALATPVLLLLTIGAVDFGRAYYQSVTISHAADTGAFYGAQNNIRSVHNTEITQMAVSDASDVGTVSATPGLVCRCPNGSQVNCITGTCSGYGAPRVYVTCEVQKGFSLLAKIPGVPDMFTVKRKAFMRVQ